MCEIFYAHPNKNSKPAAAAAIHWEDENWMTGNWEVSDNVLPNMPYKT